MDAARFFGFSHISSSRDASRAIDDFSDIESHAQNRNGDLWIVDGNDALMIKYFSRRELAAGDFVFDH